MLDSYLEYALDIPASQRERLFASLDREDPELGARLRAAYDRAVQNPDFACQTAPKAAPERDGVRGAALPVGDLERAVAWYLATFRCQLKHRDDERAVLSFDGGDVHLVAGGAAPRLTLVRPDVAGMGPSHRRPDGVRALHLVDPWGNAIEVVDR